MGRVRYLMRVKEMGKGILKGLDLGKLMNLGIVRH